MASPHATISDGASTVSWRGFTFEDKAMLENGFAITVCTWVLQAEHRANLLGGVTVLQGKALDGDQRPINLTAVPYYAWQNRDKGAMTVWIRKP